MPKNNSIVIVEDDPEDQDILRRLFLELKVPNALKFFPSGDQAFHYLLTTSEKPFMVISDINMPGMSGMDLLKKINADKSLRQKCMPFVFLSTSTDEYMIKQAFEMTAQGYFAKTWNLDEYARTIQHIVEYWKQSRRPVVYS